MDEQRWSVPSPEPGTRNPKSATQDTNMLVGWLVEMRACHHLAQDVLSSANAWTTMPSTISNVVPYHPNEYIQTALTGNKVSRKATILGSQNIILGGKCVIQQGAIIRGDLKRIAPPSTASATTGGQAQQAQSVTIMIGRYCLLAESSVIRPPYKTYKG